MNRLAIFAALGAGLALGTSMASATEIDTFDAPYALDASYASWSPFNAPPGVEISNPTNFEVQSTGYGSGYFSIYGHNPNQHIDASGNSTVQLDASVLSGIGGFLVDLYDGEGEGYQFGMGFGLLPGGGTGGGNEYLLQVPVSSGKQVAGTLGTPLDLSQLVSYHIENDPGSSSQASDITFNDLSLVNVPEPTGIAACGLLGLLASRRRRRA